MKPRVPLVKSGDQQAVGTPPNAGNRRIKHVHYIAGIVQIIGFVAVTTRACLAISRWVGRLT